MNQKGTESINQEARQLDRMSTEAILSLINKENANAVEAVGRAMPEIVRACDAAAASVAAGGRIIYMGAGTSGRLGVMDAAECPPTFGVSNETVQGIIAGGNDCMFCAKEGAEDDGEAGVRDLAAKNITDQDTIVGVSASGNAPYVVAALAYANECGCTTVSVTCNRDCKMAKTAKIAIVAETGAEVVAGSTRMKAGTAQKLILNMISTAAMVKTGKVYGNMMINLRPTNVKLTGRMVFIVTEIMGCDEVRAKQLLDENDWSIRRIVDRYLEA